MPAVFASRLTTPAGFAGVCADTAAVNNARVHRYWDRISLCITGFLKDETQTPKDSPDPPSLSPIPYALSPALAAINPYTATPTNPISGTTYPSARLPVCLAIHPSPSGKIAPPTIAITRNDPA